MKNKLSITFILIIISQLSFAQFGEYEWIVENTADSPGERIVAILDAGTIGNWDGVELAGYVVDNNGNWGYDLPTVSPFKLYVKFSGGLSYSLVQSEKTKHIVLRLRKISDSKVHLIALCEYSHQAASVYFRRVEGNVTITLGSTTTIDASGTLLIEEPTYKSSFSGKVVTPNLQAGKSRIGVLDYALNGTPTYGVKIKTNLDFVNGSQMPTIFIEGYNYAGSKAISLQLVYYVYNGKFIRSSISSSGGYTPRIVLGEEGGKVVISIDSKQYYQRFTVRAFEMARTADNDTWYDGWIAVDESLTATNFVEVPYSNVFGGNVLISQVGAQSANLEVAGNIKSREVKVTVDAGADYVFEPDYDLQPLQELDKYIKQNKHLPEVPSAAEMEEEGIELSKMNILLLKKVEELTLYVLQLEEKNKELEKSGKEYNSIIENLIKRVEELERRD